MQYLERPTNRFQKTLDRIPILGDVLRQPLGAIGFVIVSIFLILNPGALGALIPTSVST